MEIISSFLLRCTHSHNLEISSREYVVLKSLAGTSVAKNFQNSVEHLGSLSAVLKLTPNFRKQYPVHDLPYCLYKNNFNTIHRSVIFFLYNFPIISLHEMFYCPSRHACPNRCVLPDWIIRTLCGENTNLRLLSLQFLQLPATSSSFTRKCHH
jgi:hypothetical protein